MNEFTQKTAYSELAKKYYPDALESLVNFIKINSVNDESTVSDDKPFGQGVRDALDYVGNLAIKLGFNVDWCDHYCTEISYGEGELIDIYAHADVVPVSKYKVGYLDHLAYKVKSSTPYSTKLNGVEKSLSKYQPSK